MGECIVHFAAASGWDQAQTKRIYSLMVPFTLSEEQQIAVDSITRLCRDDIAPAMNALERTPEFPEHERRKWLKQLREYGLGSGRVPEADGGMGLNMVTSGLLLEAAGGYLEHLPSVAFINEGTAVTLSALATPEIRKKYLEPLVEAEISGCSANTEPSGGSDVKSIKTYAKPTATGFRITGRKIWITNGDHAQFTTVLARSEDTGGLDIYVVDREEHGYDVRPLVTSGRVATAELAFDEVEVPKENRLATGGRGLATILAAFQAARAYVGLISLAGVYPAYRAALAYSRERSQFGRPIGQMQAVQHQLADCAVEIDAARLLIFRALQAGDEGEDAELSGSMAKLFATEAAQRIASRAIQIHGGYGVSDDLPLEQIARTARAGTIVEGTSEIQRNIIGRKITGLSAF